MKKKLLTIFGITVVVIVLILIAIPFFLESKIGDIIRTNVNNNVNATLDFEDADLSLLGSFPNAEMRLQEVVLINKAPFEGDTLFAAKEVSLKMGLAELFKSRQEAIGVKDFQIDGATLNIKIDAEENANYDIAKDTDAGPGEDTASDGFSFDLQAYGINDSKVVYEDLATGILLVVSEMHHSGKGDLSLENSELQTNTEALVSFTMDSLNYLDKNSVKLDALVGIDLKENKYSFLENEALVNQLPLVFDGFVQVKDDSQEVDISFKTPSSDFKNFLAVIPETYSKSIANVSTTGDFTVNGQFKGTVDERHIPKFDIHIGSENASFKYPDLPKSVRNVFIDVDVINATGLAEDTYVDIKRASFMIEEDRFNLVSRITDLLGNTKVNAHVDGQMNLANISEAYPVPANLDLGGRVTADVTTAFDMATIERGQYEKTKLEGSLAVADFEYRSEEMPNAVMLDAVMIDFNPTTVQLRKMSGSTGDTDFNVSGQINNLLGYLFNDEKVRGNFDLVSNTFSLADFETKESPDDGTGQGESGDAPTGSGPEQIKIPTFLDADVNAAIGTVRYDNIELKDVRGNLRISDGTASLNDMRSSLFGGQVGFNGQVSTKSEVPTFGMKLDMDQLPIGETFRALELFRNLAPIARVLRGELDTDIELSGNLTDQLVPDLLTLSGNMLANVMTREINKEEAPLLTALDGKLDFIDFTKLDLDDLKTKLSFENGLVSVKPFTINYQDIAITVDGGHTFDQKLNYKVAMEVPAKYLGSEVNNLIAQIGEDELKDLTIPVVASIGGNYTSPEVQTDLTGGVRTLTNRLVEIQKQKLKDKGKEKARDLIGEVLSGGSNDTDSTKTQNNDKERVREALGGILGQSSKDSVKTPADSAPPKKTEEQVKEKAKDILGGLFGKKKETVEKDSVN